MAGARVGLVRRTAIWRAHAFSDRTDHDHHPPAYPIFALDLVPMRGAQNIGISALARPVAHRPPTGPGRLGRRLSSTSSALPPPPPLPPSSHRRLTPRALGRALRLAPLAVVVPLVAYALVPSGVIELDEARTVDGKGGRAFPVGDRLVVRPDQGFITAEQLQSHTTTEKGVWVVVDGDVWE